MGMGGGGQNGIDKGLLRRPGRISLFWRKMRGGVLFHTGSCDEERVDFRWSKSRLRKFWRGDGTVKVILQRLDRIFWFGGVDLHNQKESSAEQESQDGGWEIAPQPNHCIMDINCAILTRNMCFASDIRRWILYSKIKLGTPVAMPRVMPGKISRSKYVIGDFRHDQPPNPASGA